LARPNDAEVPRTAVWVLGQSGSPGPSATLCSAADDGNFIPHGAGDVEGEVVKDPKCPRPNDDKAKEQLMSISRLALDKTAFSKTHEKPGRKGLNKT
jgi:hypothetical protein